MGRGSEYAYPPEKEVTQEPKPLGAQLPYESDSFEPGNHLTSGPVDKGNIPDLLYRVKRNNKKICFLS